MDKCAGLEPSRTLKLVPFFMAPLRKINLKKVQSPTQMGMNIGD